MARPAPLRAHVFTGSIVGVAASYSGEAMRFLHKFDVANHDHALNDREFRDFVERARRLFEEGHAFDADEENKHPP